MKEALLDKFIQRKLLWFDEVARSPTEWITSTMHLRNEIAYADLSSNIKPIQCLFFPNQPYPTPSYPIIPYSILPYPPNHTLFHPTCQPNHTLPYPPNHTLLHPTLPCPILSCPTHPTIPFSTLPYTLPHSTLLYPQFPTQIHHSHPTLPNFNMTHPTLLY